MSKDKRKKIARAILFQTFATERERAARKVAKSERDAKAKREKRAAVRMAREAAAAAGVVGAPIDDGADFYVAWTKQDVAQVLGQN